MENRNLAVECFTEALRTDVYCYEAFDSLVNHHMMTAEEGQSSHDDHILVFNLIQNNISLDSMSVTLVH